MSVWMKLRGVMGNLFGGGGPDGPNLDFQSDHIALRDNAGTGWVKGRAGDVPTTASDLHDIINLLMARSRVALIEFSFDGASPPAGGDNSNKFGFCHTTGGDYTAGDVVFDTGSALQVLPADVAGHLTTTSAITGTISMIANGFYAREGASWVLKGDLVGAAVGLVRTIEVAYAYSDDGTPVLSTTEIEDGARVVNVQNVVEVAFNAGAPTVLVEVHGASADATIMATADSKPRKANTYVNPDVTKIGATTEGPVRVTVSKDGSTAGSGRVLVQYVKPFA